MPLAGISREGCHRFCIATRMVSSAVADGYMETEKREAQLSLADSFGFSLPDVLCHNLASKRLKHLAGLALHQPNSLSRSDIREIGGSVLALIEQYARRLEG